MCDVGCRHRFFLGIGTKTVNLAAHVNCGFVERVTEVRTRIAADDQGSSLSHESGHVSHAAADNDLAAFQRDTTAGGGIVFDEQQSAVTGRSGALGGAAFDTNRARDGSCRTCCLSLARCRDSVRGNFLSLMDTRYSTEFTKLCYFHHKSFAR